MPEPQSPPVMAGFFMGLRAKNVRNYYLLKLFYVRLLKLISVRLLKLISVRLLKLFNVRLLLGNFALMHNIIAYR